MMTIYKICISEEWLCGRGQHHLAIIRLEMIGLKMPCWRQCILCSDIDWHKCEFQNTYTVHTSKKILTFCWNVMLSKRKKSIRLCRLAFRKKNLKLLLHSFRDTLYSDKVIIYDVDCSPSIGDCLKDPGSLTTNIIVATCLSSMRKVKMHSI